MKCVSSQLLGYMWHGDNAGAPLGVLDIVFLPPQEVSEQRLAVCRCALVVCLPLRLCCSLTIDMSDPLRCNTHGGFLIASLQPSCTLEQ